MTINKQCMVKSLKSDYRLIGTIGAAIAIVVLTTWAILAYPDQVVNGVYFLVQPAGWIYSFAAIEILIMIGIPYILLFVGNNTPEYEKSIHDSDTTPAIIILTLFFMAIIAVVFFGIVIYVYTMRNIAPIPSELSWGATIGLMVIEAFIVCPVMVAVARCKE